ncbi:MAG: sigma factor [Pirellulaceae bacterium]
MNDEERLSRLETLWSVVYRAHGDETIDAAAARHELMDRYGGAAKRYLRGALRSDSDAEEVFQEFSLRMIRGDFHRADEEKGRFRQFVKTALFRMIVDFQRARGKSAGQQHLQQAPEPAIEDPLGDDAFAQSWRKELIEKTLARMQDLDVEQNRGLCEILQIRIQNPQMRSPDLADLASQSLNKTITAENYRALLRRARLQFATILLDEVTQSLDMPTPDSLESELAELDLLEYCRPALER